MLTTTLPSCTLRPWHADDLPALLRHANSRAVQGHGVRTRGQVLQSNIPTLHCP